MKKLLFAIAGAASFAALAADPSPQAGDISVVGFESYAVDATVIGYGDDGQASGDSLWSCAGDDASLVKAYAGGEVSAPNIKGPDLFANAAENAQYLALDTNGSELQRAIPQNGQAIAAGGTYIDTLVQFTPSESAPTLADLSGAKLAIWLGVVNNVTNLYVQGGYIEGPDGEGTPTIDTAATQAYKLGNIAVEAGQWYRLTVKAVKLDDDGAGNTISGFQILVDGTLAVSDTAVADAAGIQYYTDYAAEAGVFPGAAGLLSAKTLIPSCAGVIADATLTSVGFKGTGALDDFVVTTNEPDLSAPAIDFTLTWASGVTPVSYTIGNGEPVAIAAGETSPFAVPGLAGGETVAFTFTNADGATKTMTTTAADDGDIDAGDAVWAWADYLGEAVAGAYTIDDANDLDMLRKGVLANLATLGETFKQTANIDMTSAGAFAGIGTYNANASLGLPFQGTYDGQGFTISNITFTDRDYAGVFNQVKGGTIKDLTVDTITFPGVGSKCSAAIVGNAGLGTTLQGLTAAGSFGTAAKPCSHNVAGIAIRLSGGASNVVDGVEVLETLVKDCTNNATLYGTYTKMGGICALTQDQNGVPNDYVLFDGCVNNGTLTMPSGSTAGRDGLAGIVAYTADGTKLQNCVNTGTMSSTLATAKKGELVGWAQGRGLYDLGGNVAAADKPMIGSTAPSDGVYCPIDGFKYATVADNNKATSVLPPLAAGATYLLEGDATDDPAATLTAVGDTIAFDAALGYTFAGTVAGSGAAGYPTASTSGTVTTYTAGYFPRTATAGQDGSAANPFEIADLDDLQALQAAVANDVGRNLAYVQVADIALTAAWPGIGMKGGKDHASEAAYDAEAFTGVYDGGNYTISNFLMENGTDYGALFNSIYNATIKNLKLSWGSSTLCANSSASGGDTGASFVGVAKASTLQNLTTVAGTVTTVSASKDFGGIVGYLMAGSTVESCTNALNVASLKNTGRKCGGIAIITQGGTGTAVIRNCKNSGTVTAANKGGILGYVGVATEIDGCENTAALQLVHFQSGSVTASGVNKGNATVASNDKSDGVSGLYFATVDGNVATFVADNALVLNGSYKVMSAGATATFAFAEAGTIAFDTALFTPTYAITAAEGLTLTDATAGTVKTYTAAAQSSGADWVDDVTSVTNKTAGEAYSDLADTALANADAAKLTTWAKANNVSFSAAETDAADYVEAFMLNCAPTAVAVEAEKEAFKVNITMGADGTPVVTTPEGKVYNVTPQLKGANSLTGEWTPVAAGSTSYQFYKAVLSL